MIKPKHLKETAIFFRYLKLKCDSSRQCLERLVWQCIKSDSLNIDNAEHVFVFEIEFSPSEQFEALKKGCFPTRA